MKNWKKWLKITLLTLVSLVLVAAISFVMMFGHEIKTLNSIKKVDDYALYTMDYDGDYGFDEFLKTGASTDGELIKFVSDRLLKGIPVKFSIPNLGCSTFNAVTPEGEFLFGRNFDLSYSPSLFVRTAPKNGYKSISTVNLGFLGYNENKLPDSFLSSIITLAAPYAPLDGVNEKGVSIGVLLIPDEATNQVTDKIDITTTTGVRLVLDKAATVDEAVELLRNYDMHSSANSSYHFQIADAEGNSAVVEYVKNEFSVVKNDTPYQAATNFLLTPGDYYNFGKGQNRYEILVNTLTEKNGVLNPSEAMDLLKAVSQDPKEDGTGSVTQWSVVYNNTTLTADFVAGRKFDQVHKFNLK